MFEQTKPLFGRWLYYGIGTMFSLAVLSFMVAVAMKMVLAVSTAFAAQYLAAMSMGMSAQGVNSMALQQGGMGLILTVLLVMTPPMAAQFFQGTLGQFGAYSAFGNLQNGVGRGRGGADSAGRTLGTPGYMPQTNTRLTDGRSGGLSSNADNAALIGTPPSSRGSQQDVIKKISNIAAQG